MTLNAVRPMLLILLLTPFGALQAQQPVTTEAPAAQEPAAPPPHADLTATARAVVLDVVVTDGKGNTVHGLNASDFVVAEDGVPQRVDSLHEHTPRTVTAAIPKLPPNYFTNFMPAASADAWTVILLDAVNNPPAVQMYVREQLVKYMKTVPPGHPIALFELDDTSMHMIQGFTTDPEVLLKAADSKRDRVESPLIGPNGRGYVQNQFRQEILTDGLRSMGRYLAGFPGRKNLIWFSGSIPFAFWGGGLGSPFPDREDVSTELADATDALELNQVSVYPIDARGLEVGPGYSAASGRAPSLGSTQNFVTRRFYDHADIEDIADRTGGKAFYNTNGLKEAIGEVIETGSNYYTLAYTPTNKDWDGKHRAIKLETTRGDLKLEYRHGYFARAETKQQERRVAALKHAAAQKGSATQTESEFQPVMISAGHATGFNAAMQLGAIPPTEVIFGVSVTAGTGTQKLDKNAPKPQGNYLSDAERGKPFRNYGLLFRIAPQTIKLTRTPEGMHHGEVQLVAVVYDDKGVEVNSAAVLRKFDMTDAQYQQIMKGGTMTLSSMVGVPAKGNYFFRFGVHDIIADHSGALEVPVDNVQMGVLGPMQQAVP